MRFIRVESPGGHYLLNIDSISEVHTHSKDSIGLFTYCEEPLIISNCSLINFESILLEYKSRGADSAVMKQCLEVVLGEDNQIEYSWYLDEKEAILDVISKEDHDKIVFYNDRDSTFYGEKVSTRLSWRLV